MPVTASPGARSAFHRTPTSASTRPDAAPADGDFEAWVVSGTWLTAEGRTLPVMPQRIGEVLRLAADPQLEIRPLVDLVSRDQALTARVLRLANVAASAPLREVTSVQQAVVRVGTSGVRNAVLSACYASWAQPAGLHGEDGVNHAEHGLATGMVARLVAPLAAMDPDEAFVLGLIHDIGKLLLLKLRAEHVRRAHATPAASEVARVVAERHAEVGGLAMQYWGLPGALRDPIRWHHDPLEATANQEAAALAYTANQLSHLFGFGVPARDAVAILDDPICLTLGVTPDWLTDVTARAPGLLDDARQALA
ncbi:MAG: HDOD domain-containing protein [Vicinamibacterales bacterium]